MEIVLRGSTRDRKTPIGYDNSVAKNPGIENEVVRKLKMAFEIARKMHHAEPMMRTRSVRDGVNGSSVVGTRPNVLFCECEWVGLCKSRGIYN
jgi:hypothetical protein